MTFGEKVLSFHKSRGYDILITLWAIIAHVSVKIPKNWNSSCRLNSTFKSIPQFGKSLGILQLHIHILRQATVTNKWLSYTYQ